MFKIICIFIFMLFSSNAYSKTIKLKCTLLFMEVNQINLKFKLKIPPKEKGSFVYYYDDQIIKWTDNKLDNETNEWLITFYEINRSTFIGKFKMAEFLPENEAKKFFENSIKGEIPRDEYGLKIFTEGPMTCIN